MALAIIYAVACYPSDLKNFCDMNLIKNFSNIFIDGFFELFTTSWRFMGTSCEKKFKYNVHRNASDITGSTKTKSRT